MKRLTLLVGCLAAVVANASAVRLDQLPLGEYADTESTTNVPFAFGQLGARNFQFEMSFAATPSNNVQLAFGRDADSDGVLSLEETDMTFGWDCGEWRIANGETGETLSSAAATTNDVKALTWDLLLRRGRPRRLAVSENGIAVFPECSGAPGQWFFSPEWDMLRLAVRGVDAPQESVGVGMKISGYKINLR
ncbi:MAG: hypothetical protein IKO55_18895 [Kiritimatiellae bacterium]|nr:hypothetical protein [Kiritimatiellia bacterium]